VAGAALDGGEGSWSSVLWAASGAALMKSAKRPVLAER